MQEYSASTMSEFIDCIVAITRAFGDTRGWWRGQADSSWGLLPGLHRRGLQASEGNLNGRFRMMAPARRTDCPSSNDPAGWLFLMQHYRLPTRLLDWTESPLVALYFAIETDATPSTDRAVWALMPTMLNAGQAEGGIMLSNSPGVRALMREAFVRNGNDPDARTLAVLTEHRDLRHLVQQSTFTIHGGDVPLDQFPESNPFLARVTIPSASVEVFRAMLGLLGISRAGLFPDLEGLALELSGLDFVGLA